MAWRPSTASIAAVFQCIFFGPQQSGFTATYTFALDENAMQTAYILGELKKRGATRVDASEKAEAAWINTIKRVARQTEEFQKSCTPGTTTTRGMWSLSLKTPFTAVARPIL